MTELQLMPAEKLSLSIKEASEYSGIPEFRIKNIIDSDENLNWVIRIGNKTKVKTKEFVEWFNEQKEI